MTNPSTDTNDIADSIFAQRQRNRRTRDRTDESDRSESSDGAGDPEPSE